MTEISESEQNEKLSGNLQTESFTEEDKGFQAVKYFLTYHIQDNEQFEDAFKRLEPLKDLCDKYIWAEEYGKTKNTPHIQGGFILKNKMRAKTLYKFFKNGVTLRKLKNWTACFNYCCKEGNKIVSNQKIPKPLKIIQDAQLYEWQIDLIEIIKGEPDDRTIYWYEGKQGAGKTQFIKYCFKNFGAIVLNGKPSDMKNGIIEYEKTNGFLPEIIFSNIGFDKDLERVQYSGYEDIKDMCFYSGKYEGGMVMGNNPHLIIFANGPPHTENEKFKHIVID